MLTAINSVLGDSKIADLFTDKYKVKRISPLKMLEQLSPVQWQGILDFYYQLKKEHVKIIIDSFKKPDDFKGSPDGKNLKDYFIERIKDNYEKNIAE